MVYLLVVYHLAQKENPFTAVFLQGTVADFDCVFNAVTKSKMAGEIKDDGTEIDNGG